MTVERVLSAGWRTRMSKPRLKAFAPVSLRFPTPGSGGRHPVSRDAADWAASLNEEATMIGNQAGQSNAMVAMAVTTTPNATLGL